MFELFDITPEITTPPASAPAPGVPSARDVQDRIMAIARRMGKLDDSELADIERRRHLGLPLLRAGAPATAMTHAALAEPAERDSVEDDDEDNDEDEHDTDITTHPVRPIAGELFDWLP